MAVAAHHNSSSSSGRRLPDGDDTVHESGTAVLTANPAIDISIALRACNLKAIPEVLKRIRALGEAPSVDEKTRLSMLCTAKELVRALETPRETMIKHCPAQVCSRLYAD